VNTKRWASILIACVAAIAVLSGCTSGAQKHSSTSAVQTHTPDFPAAPTTKQPVAPTPGSKHDIAEHDPAVGDEWANWSTGTTIPEMRQLAKLWHLDEIDIPRDSYTKDGFIGVAKLGRYCIVAFVAAGSNTQVGLTVLSRFNQHMTAAYDKGFDPGQVASKLAIWRPVCANAAPMPLGSGTATA